MMQCFGGTVTILQPAWNTSKISEPTNASQLKENFLWTSTVFTHRVFLPTSRCVDAYPSDRPPQRGQGLRQWQLCPQRGALHADWLLCGLLHPTGHHGGDILPHHTGTRSFSVRHIKYLCLLSSCLYSVFPSGAPEAGHCLPVWGKGFLPAAFARTSNDKHVTASEHHLPPSSD